MVTVVVLTGGLWAHVERLQLLLRCANNIKIYCDYGITFYCTDTNVHSEVLNEIHKIMWRPVLNTFLDALNRNGPVSLDGVVVSCPIANIRCPTADELGVYISQCLLILLLVYV